MSLIFSLEKYDKYSLLFEKYNILTVYELHIYDLLKLVIKKSNDEMMR